MTKEKGDMFNDAQNRSECCEMGSEVLYEYWGGRDVTSYSALNFEFENKVDFDRHIVKLRAQWACVCRLSEGQEDESGS